jgi:hypothetical protein
VPLLEKAYACAHGDYDAIHDLYVGDVLEDFTDGITEDFDLSAVPNLDRLWDLVLLPNRPELKIFDSNRRIEADDPVGADDCVATSVAVLKAVYV